MHYKNQSCWSLHYRFERVIVRPMSDVIRVFILYLQIFFWGGGGNFEIVSISHGIILSKKKNRTEDLLVTRNEVVSSYYYYFFFQILCTRFLENYSTDFQHFFTDDESSSEFYMFLKFLLSSLPVPIYRPFCSFLRPILCRADLRNYQRYDYEIFRIGSL